MHATIKQPLQPYLNSHIVSLYAFFRQSSKLVLNLPLFRVPEKVQTQLEDWWKKNIEKEMRSELKYGCNVCYTVVRVCGI